MRTRTVLALFGALMLGAVTSPAQPGGTTPGTEVMPEGYRLGAGPWKVGKTPLTLRDEARKKDLRVVVRFPVVPAEVGASPTGDAAEAEPPKFPLVLFSHGMGGSSEAFPELSEHLASHGYIVVHPTHDDSVALQRDRGESVRGFLRDPKAYRARVDPVGRVDDLKFLIDQIGTMERESGMRGRIDAERIGVAGHSAGAMTTQLIIGTRARGVRLGGGRALELNSIGDDRVDAGVVISGQGTTTRMFTENSWEGIKVPMLVIAGSNDTSPASAETPESRRHPFEFSRGVGAGGPPAYLLYIQGAYHSSYGGKLADSPQEGRMIVDCTHAAVLALLDAFLKDEPAAREFLNSDEGIRTLSKGRAAFSVK
jgi:predicted dienelactone hydrolase